MSLGQTLEVRGNAASSPLRASAGDSNPAGSGSVATLGFYWLNAAACCCLLCWPAVPSLEAVVVLPIRGRGGGGVCIAHSYVCQ